MLYVCVCCFVVRGCAVSRRYIDVCYCDMFSVVNVYLGHLKFCVACRRYVCCDECYVVSDECDEPTSSKTLEKVILPYITQNIQNITTRVQNQTLHKHSTTQHQQHCRNMFQPTHSTTRTIALALDMSKAFDTVNTHTLIDKLTQTNISHTILRYIANYIKGRMTYTTFRNHKSIKRQFKSGVPQGGVLSPILFNIYTSDIPTTTRLCTTDHIRGRHNYHSTTH